MGSFKINYIINNGDAIGVRVSSIDCKEDGEHKESAGFNNWAIAEISMNESPKFGSNVASEVDSSSFNRMRHSEHKFHAVGLW